MRGYFAVEGDDGWYVFRARATITGRHVLEAYSDDLGLHYVQVAYIHRHGIEVFRHFSTHEGVTRALRILVSAPYVAAKAYTRASGRCSTCDRPLATGVNRGHACCALDGASAAPLD